MNRCGLLRIVFTAAGHAAQLEIPNWTAEVVYRDNNAHFFDGAKDMFRYLHELDKYATGHRKEDISSLGVTEFYGLAKIDACSRPCR